MSILNDVIEAIFGTTPAQEETKRTAPLAVYEATHAAPAVAPGLSAARTTIRQLRDVGPVDIRTNAGQATNAPVANTPFDWATWLKKLVEPTIAVINNPPVVAPTTPTTGGGTPTSPPVAPPPAPPPVLPPPAPPPTQSPTGGNSSGTNVGGVTRPAVTTPRSNGIVQNLTLGSF